VFLYSSCTLSLGGIDFFVGMTGNLEAFPHQAFSPERAIQGSLDKGILDVLSNRRPRGIRD
jgi:hypothetical protein